MGYFSVTIPRVSNSLRADTVLSNLSSTSVALLGLQNQLSSGKRISKYSDDPYDATVAGQLQSLLEQKARFQQNIQDATGVLSSADSAHGR